MNIMEKYNNFIDPFEIPELKQLLREHNLRFVQEISSEEEDLLSKPKNIHAAVNTIYSQFSIIDQENRSLSHFTPAVPAQMFEHPKIDDATKTLSIFLVEPENFTYAILKDVYQGKGFLDIPLYLFRRENGKTIVKNSKNENVNDEQELKLLRFNINQFKYYYHYRVVEYANCIDLSKDLFMDDATLSVQNSLNFYLCNEENQRFYPKLFTDFDFDVGSCYYAIMKKAFENFEDATPTPKKHSPVRLERITLTTADNREKEIDDSRLWQLSELQRAMRTFDSDNYLLEEFREKELEERSKLN
jgi:hypothetical protein